MGFSNVQSEVGPVSSTGQDKDPAWYENHFSIQTPGLSATLQLILVCIIDWSIFE